MLASWECLVQADWSVGPVTMARSELGKGQGEWIREVCRLGGCAKSSNELDAGLVCRELKDAQQDCTHCLPS